MHPPTEKEPVSWSREAAYGSCERMARGHYENFTVGSRLLPKEKRRHVYAIYGYCRTVDDLGDEAKAGQKSSEASHRLALLDSWQADLEACYSGTPSHPVMV